MEDQETQHLLNENLRLAKENKRMLDKIYKFHKRQMAFKVLYWIALVALGLGAYYYAKPYIDNIHDAYNSIGATFSDLKNTFSAPKQ